VSFYNTPLSALHKVLADWLKPLAANAFKLRDSAHCKQRLSEPSFNDPAHPYLASLDVKALYTNCDMTKATDTAIAQFNEDPNLLPSGISADTMHQLLTFCLDNSYFEFNNTHYSQDSGGTMGSPLIVVLAEIRTYDQESTALLNCPDPPRTYIHFVDDGLAPFRDRQHADSYLTYINSLNTDLQYTIEHPRPDGSLPFLDILIHTDKTTSVYRKPTHTNLYVKYNSTTPNSTKDSVIRSLVQRAFNICSPQHLKTELDTVHTICLSNGFPSRRVHTIINKIATKITSPKPQSLAQFNQQFKANNYPLHVQLPYHPSLSKPLKQVLQKHDIKVTFSAPTNLRNMLTKTKSTPPSETTPHCVYEIPCSDCPATYVGQTYRPLLTRIKEHDSKFRNKTATDDDGTIVPGPAHHAITEQHRIDWNNVQILTTTTSRPYLNLLEHSAINTRDATMNRSTRAPKINPLWDSKILSKINSTFRPRPSNITANMLHSSYK